MYFKNVSVQASSFISVCFYLLQLFSKVNWAIFRASSSTYRLMTLMISQTIHFCEWYYDLWLCVCCLSLCVTLLLDTLRNQSNVCFSTNRFLPVFLAGLEVQEQVSFSFSTCPRCSSRGPQHSAYSCWFHPWLLFPLGCQPCWAEEALASFSVTCSKSHLGRAATKYRNE